MYGLLRLPSSSGSAEKAKYRKYMCALCGALHKDYGIKSRLLVGYDCTTLALLIGVLDESFDRAVLSASRNKPISCFSKSRVPLNGLEFVSAVSVVLAYTKFLDRAMDQGNSVPKWVVRMSDLAFKKLVPYGLTRSFFVDSLKQQHELEGLGCDDIEALSAVSSVIVSRICGGIADLIGNSQYFVPLQALGNAIGKMIYILDGVSDYGKDLRSDSFNCIKACYPEDVWEVGDFLNSIRGNIASLLDEMQVGTSLLSEILLDGSVVRLKTKLYCDKGLVEQGVYSLLGGVWISQPLMDDSIRCPECCLECCADCPKCCTKSLHLTCAPYFKGPLEDIVLGICCCPIFLVVCAIAFFSGGRSTEAPTKVIIVHPKNGCCD